jgi:hypothetical protein
MWFVVARSYLSYTEMKLKVTYMKSVYNLYYLLSLPCNLSVVAYVIFNYVHCSLNLHTFSAIRVYKDSNKIGTQCKKILMTRQI